MIPSLERLFHVGALMPCYVTAVGGRRVSLSVNPRLVNTHLTAKDIRPNMVGVGVGVGVGVWWMGVGTGGWVWVWVGGWVGVGVGVGVGVDVVVGVGMWWPGEGGCGYGWVGHQSLYVPYSLLVYRGAPTSGTLVPRPFPPIVRI